MPAARSPRHTGGTGRYDRSRGASARLTIGKVIARLEPDFPDLTVSKVRFLESEGLLTPERTGSGYRTYSESDVERLRYILTVQREHFWPLKVIRDALEARDRGDEPVLPPTPQPSTRMTAAQLAAAAEAPEPLVEALISAGLLSPDGSGRFGSEDQQILESVVWLQAFGIEPRHLRPFRAAADRELGLIEQMLAPSAPGKDRRVRAAQMANRLRTIHTALVSKGLQSLR
ncbi:MAG: MerR family transcriptional regulator [Actinomycetales bacterium]|nr:MerR family transcriptional regulator [Tetrasphaera sp.]NLX00166.1 MerR family transcriptional regulator [Actinomycetales bacterium]